MTFIPDEQRLSHWDIYATEKARDLFERSLCGGEPDALQSASGQGFETFERESQMRSALRGNQGMDLVDDDGVDRPKCVS